VPPARKALHVRVDHKETDGAVGLTVARLRGDHDPVGVTAVRDEHLAPIEDVRVAATLGPRLDGGQVAARAGLRDGEGA
jgi:hypothetical protein